MPEYLAPGVYIEEIEMGARPIEGVSTSTAGMVGVTKKGRSDGLPVLVTSFADFQKKFGGFLGSKFGDDRYLAYAVDSFFRNGGQKVYIKRILFPGAAQAIKTTPSGIKTRLAEDTADLSVSTSSIIRRKVKLLSLRGIQVNSTLTFMQLNDDGSINTEDGVVVSYDQLRGEITLQDLLTHKYTKEKTKVILNNIPIGQSVTFKAMDKGRWGENIKIEVYTDSKVWSTIAEIITNPSTSPPITTTNSTKFRLKSSAGFYVGAIVELDNGNTKQYRRIMTIEDDVIELNYKFDNNNANVVTSPGATTQKRLSTCEFTLVVSYQDQTESQTERLDNLSTNPDTPNYYLKVIKDKSNLINADPLYRDSDNPSLQAYNRNDPFDQPAGEDGLNIILQGGSDGTGPASATEYIGIRSPDPGKKTGIRALEDIDEISIIAAPGVKDPTVQAEMIDQCENLKDRFAILDSPHKSSIEEIKAHRKIFDSKYAALYYPWIKTYDSLEKVDFYIPPSGGIAGIYARSDTERGVHKAPANEIFRGATDLEIKLGKGEQSDLNPMGINCIRAFPGRGIRVWGARTISPPDSLWKYVNVRRLFLFLEESIDEGTQWVVFEPNDEKLWARVTQTITQFLTQVWRDGALMGTKAEDAFFVRCDRTTMTQNDIDTGKLIVVIGVSPVKPAEFVIFRIAQFTAGAKSE